MQLLVGFERVRLPAAAPLTSRKEVFGRRSTAGVRQGSVFLRIPQNKRRLERVRFFTLGCKGGRVGVLLLELGDYRCSRLGVRQEHQPFLPGRGLVQLAVWGTRGHRLRLQSCYRQLRFLLFLARNKVGTPSLVFACTGVRLVGVGRNTVPLSLTCPCLGRGRGKGEPVGRVLLGGPRGARVRASS